MRYSINYLVVKSLKALGVDFDSSKSEAVKVMQKQINDLGAVGLQFSITIEPNGDWVAECVNLPGIITGGTTRDSVDGMIKDAVFTYFDIPAKYCDDRLLRPSGEAKTTKQQMFLATAKA